MKTLPFPALLQVISNYLYEVCNENRQVFALKHINCFASFVHLSGKMLGRLSACGHAQVGKNTQMKLCTYFTG